MAIYHYCENCKCRRKTPCKCMKSEAFLKKQQQPIERAKNGGEK